MFSCVPKIHIFLGEVVMYNLQWIICSEHVHHLLMLLLLLLLLLLLVMVAMMIHAEWVRSTNEFPYRL